MCFLENKLDCIPITITTNWHMYSALQFTE